MLLDLGGWPVYKLLKKFKININWLLSGEGKPYLKRLKYPPNIGTKIIKMEARIAALEKRVSELAKKVLSHEK